MSLLRRPSGLLYAAIFVGEVAWTAMIPLVPSYADAFDLSERQAGVLLASASVAILVVSLPSAPLADRLGTRVVTVGALGLMALADATQALAHDFAQLLVARLAFGIAFGLLWTSGIAWLADGSGRHRARALSLTVTTAGVGGIAGPAFAGLLVGTIGLRAPFLAIAGVTIALAGALLWTEPHGGHPSRSTFDIPALLKQARTEPFINTSLLLTAVAGFTGSAVNLLVPLQLHSDGESASSIGYVFALAALVFIASSAIVARQSERAARLSIASTSVVLLAIVLTFPILGSSPEALIAFLLVRAPVIALLFTITYPLGETGARRVGMNLTAVVALLNVFWATAALAGPIAAANITQASSIGLTYTVLSCCAVGTGCWMMAHRTRTAV